MASNLRQRPLAAEDLANRQFSNAFRGFDQDEVRAFLAEVAGEMAAAEERERQLRQHLAEAEARPTPTQLDEAELDAALGQEAGRVLRAAHEAASEIKEKAASEADARREEARRSAAESLAGSESLLDERTAEAEEAAKAIGAQADRDAAARVEEAREEGRRMLAEAQAVRSRVLADLARKRTLAHGQVEQLRVGRDRLLEAYAVVRATLEEATRELTVAEAEARAKAEVAAPSPEPGPTAEEIQAEMRLPGRSAARPEPEPVVAEEPEPEPVVADEPEPVVAEEPEPEPVVADEPDLVLAAEPEPEPVVAAEEPEPDTVVAEAPAPAAEAPTAEPESAGADATRALFAKIRAAEPAPQAGTTQAQSVEPRSAETLGAASAETASGDDPELLRRRDGELAPIGRELQRALKRALSDEHNRVLDAIRRANPTGIEALLPGAGVHAGTYAEVARPALRAALDRGAGSWVPGVEAPSPAPPVDDVVAALGTEVADDLRHRLVAALDQGEPADLPEAVAATYRTWRGQKVEPLADHHLARAYALGRYRAAPETKLRWVVDEAEGGCPDCDDNALAGLTHKGEPFPTGALHPPAHDGCRCELTASAEPPPSRRSTF